MIAPLATPATHRSFGRKGAEGFMSWTGSSLSHCSCYCSSRTATGLVCGSMDFSFTIQVILAAGLLVRLGSFRLSSSIRLLGSCIMEAAFNSMTSLLVIRLHVQQERFNGFNSARMFLHQLEFFS
ncbi:unnamed protein product [Ilex paraguariensis]|uniref:Uncharacterized protein n=1 Tax=Ilex paraguariensis TaxID=185542 RepID=A0ABC8UKZ0_9AQUA